MSGKPVAPICVWMADPLSVCQGSWRRRCRSCGYMCQRAALSTYPAAHSRATEASLFYRKNLAFSLRMYFYALTAHFGTWIWPKGARKFHWKTDKDLLYGQFRKVRKGFRIANIYTIVQWGERKMIQKKLQAIDLTRKDTDFFC